jgi:hypothetical protein
LTLINSSSFGEYESPSSMKSTISIVLCMCVTLFPGCCRLLAPGLSPDQRLGPRFTGSPDSERKLYLKTIVSLPPLLPARADFLFTGKGVYSPTPLTSAPHSLISFLSSESFTKKGSLNDLRTLFWGASVSVCGDVHLRQEKRDTSSRMIIALKVPGKAS